MTLHRHSDACERESHASASEVGAAWDPPREVIPANQRHAGRHAKRAAYAVTLLMVLALNIVVLGPYLAGAGDGLTHPAPGR